METVRQWIVSHFLVDLALQVAVVAVAFVLALGALCGTVYLLLLMWRLTRPKNRQTFFQRPIPTVRGGAVLGQRLDLEPIKELEHLTGDAVELLNTRVKGLEDIVQRLGDRLEKWEDVTGHH